MIMWIIVLCLGFFDSFYINSYLNPSQRGEKNAYNWFWLFFLNYIPLALFDFYHSEISFFLNSSGLWWLGDIKYQDFWKSVWIWLFDFLEYSRILFWYSFWLSCFVILLIIAYDHNYPGKTKKFSIFWMLNSFFLLLYNISAEKLEYFILYAIMFGIYILKLKKIKYRDFWTEKYESFVFINTIFTIKQIFCYDCVLFDLCYYLITCYFSIIIIFLVIIYFGVSSDDTYLYLAAIWKEFQEKRKNSFHFEEVEWKICKIYGLLLFNTYFMYISNKLIGILWGDIWLLREMMIIIGSGTLGQILVYPEYEYSINASSQPTFNTISVYCQIWVIREIIGIIL